MVIARTEISIFTGNRVWLEDHGTAPGRRIACVVHAGGVAALIAENDLVRVILAGVGGAEKSVGVTDDHPIAEVFIRGTIAVLRTFAGVDSPFALSKITAFSLGTWIPVITGGFEGPAHAACFVDTFIKSALVVIVAIGFTSSGAFTQGVTGFSIGAGVVVITGGIDQDEVVASGRGIATVSGAAVFIITVESRSGGTRTIIASVSVCAGVSIVAGKGVVDAGAAIGFVAAIVRTLIAVIAIDRISGSTDTSNARSFSGTELAIIATAIIEFVGAALCRVTGVCGAGVAVIA